MDTSTSSSRTSTALLAALATVVGIAFALVTSLTLGTNSADAIASPTYDVTDLGTLDGQHISSSGINDSGQAVGFAYTSDWVPQAFLYKNGQMQDLGTLGSQDSYAYDINDSGQAVGTFYTSAGAERAFLYKNGQMQDLNSLIPQDSGWSLLDAFAINTAGQIVGVGLINGQNHDFLLTPKPPPAEPQLDLPADITREATGPKGAVVNYTATATDEVDGSVQVECAPASGSVFGLGTTTVNCSATDTDGNTANGSFKITVEDTTPPETTIDSGPSGTVSSTSASFSFSSSETGSTFECSLDGSTFESCTSPKSYSSLSQGNHTFRVRVIDKAGNIDATPASRSWFVDTVVPKGTISIKGGAASTSSRLVTLWLSASDPSPASGVDSMRFKNGGTTTWSSWFDYSTSKSWTLTAGAGTKTVYVQYKDQAGNNSATASDTITFSP